MQILKRGLLSQLLHLRIVVERDKNQESICFCINRSHFQLTRELFKTWKGFSGNIYYPVEGNDIRYHRQGRKGFWNDETWYGQRRHELLDHMIQSLEQELKNSHVDIRNFDRISIERM